MAFRLFLTDEIETAELDVEDIQNSTLISLLDIQDLGSRKNPIQSLQIKGTKANNYAFGQFFDIAKSTNDAVSNRLYFNYNPLRAVKCLLYEDTELIFVGSLRLAEYQVDRYGEATYSCIVTTALTELKNVLQEKQLSDLDLTDLRHRYRIQTIKNSWSTSTETFNRFTGQFNNQPFEYGMNYVYPHIDYGYKFGEDTNGAEFNNDFDNWNFQNYKPALYLKEYFDRIFSLPELSGYSYEIRGYDDFIEQFNRVIVPDNRENLEDKIQGFTTVATLVTGTTSGFTPFSVQVAGNNFAANITRTIPSIRLIQADRAITTLGWFYLQNSSGGQLRVLKTFRTNWRLVVRGTVSVASDFEPATMKIAIVNDDKTIGEISRDLAAGQTLSFDFDVTFGDFKVEAGSKVFPRILFIPIDGQFDVSGLRTTPYISYTINQCDIYCPANENSQFAYEPNSSQVYSTNGNLTGPLQEPPRFYIGTNTYEYNVYDFVTPAPPTGIKILDFLKTVINQFNMVVYTNNENYKHLIFEEYDSFYRFCTPTNLISNALDWTGKIDYSSGFKVKSNLQIPKSYLFTYKTDVDYLTKTYQDKFNEVYGSFQFFDQYGLTPEKKVELITSPTVISNINGSDRKLPLLYTVDNGEVKKAKTNTRFMYFNGLVGCQPYYIRNQIIRFWDDDSTYINQVNDVNAYLILSGLTTDVNIYPQASNYFIKPNTGFTSGYEVIQNMHFNEAKEVYFDYSDDYQNSPNSYNLYYIQSVTDLTNLDVTYVEANVLLSPVDIANLDLRIPVYIQTGENNGAYFKVLKVEYQEKDKPSQVLLQKITF